MNMILSTPSTVLLPEVSDTVKEFLTYSDTSIQYQIKELSKKHHWKRNDPDAFNARMDELKAQAYKTLLKYDGGRTAIHVLRSLVRTSRGVRLAARSERVPLHAAEAHDPVGAQTGT